MNSLIWIYIKSRVKINNIKNVEIYFEYIFIDFMI